MTTTDDLQSQIERVRLAYAEIAGLRERLAALQTVEQARAEYELLLADVASELDALKQRRDELDLKRRKGALPQHSGEEIVVPPPHPPWRRRQPWNPAAPEPRVTAARGQGANQEARGRLKKLVNRMAYAWRLKGDVQGQINRIADDADRPLGEALALLDLSVFERSAPHEREQEHLARLEEWGAALLEYRERLAGDIDIQETRYRGWLNIWSKWRARASGPEGQARWESFIADTRRDKQAEIEETRAQLARAAAGLGRAEVRRTESEADR